MKRIGVLCSGGDAPGMNACIRAVVRTAIARGLEVTGIRRGYRGLVDDDLIPMNSRSVSGIIQHGGTILETSRCEEFRTPEGRARAYRVAQSAGLDGLVLLGGDGTFRGAIAFYDEWKLPSVGVPCTIDNDVAGTSFTIGFDTAVNTALDAIDKIRDTASSLQRLFLVEVMGRKSGYIAQEVALAGGAEAVLVPEVRNSIPRLCERISNDMTKGKRAWIIVVAEGDEAGGAFAVGKELGSRLNLDYRVTVLGHIQRGGRPTARDRALACLLGASAVEGLLAGKTNCMVGRVGGRVVFTPFEKVVARKKPLDASSLRLVSTLAG
ncbi:MAG: 6-phosphofructokinase [Chloroflexota bacterium]|nr:6-phosphofructokinase [Chloroflexota bacterium]